MKKKNAWTFGNYGGILQFNERLFHRFRLRLVLRRAREGILGILLSV